MEQFIKMGEYLLDVGKTTRSSTPSSRQAIELCKPFVFEHEGIDIYDQRYFRDSGLVVAPFPVFSLEIPTVYGEDGFDWQQVIVTNREGREHALQLWKDLEDAGGMDEEMKLKLTHQIVYAGIGVIMVDTRLSAKWPVLYCLNQKLLDEDMFLNAQQITEKHRWMLNVSTHTLESDEPGYDFRLGVVNLLLGMMEVERTVKKPSNKSIKYRKPGNRKKKQKVIKSCVFIVGKNPKRTPGDGSKIVEWTHQWPVRGHWRRHNGIGKNADGVYCENGRTWVKDCIKGPEDKKLVEKQHVVRKV